MTAQHRFAEHTGEVELCIQADSLPEVFAEAGRAMARLMLNQLPSPPEGAPASEVGLEARDLATLLVDWLNELIFRTEVERTVFTEFDVSVQDCVPARLTASLRGVADPPLAGQVKAATLHLARLERAQGTGLDAGYQANIVLDV